jgi:two-component system, chemotaxis family, protein-glutamate methylesterase/glutaminase
VIAPAPPTAIRVVVLADDSPDRAKLIQVIRHDGDIAVIAQSDSSGPAITLINETRPQAVIVDLQLGEGTSLQAIEQIMAHMPTSILVLSAPGQDRSSPQVAKAIVAGAVDTLARTAGWPPELGVELRRAIRQVSKVGVIRHPRGRLSRLAGSDDRSPAASGPVVAVAASTGGPAALATVLSGLGGLAAPVLVVQHLHPDFTAGLVEWMARAGALPVQVARHGELARPGHVYVAPGELHLRLAANRHLTLSATPASMHRPSADQLFSSVAEAAGAAGVGVVLTGMGEDGAEGLLAMHRAGGRTLGQDEATCAVFGMPRAAQRIGAVSELLPVEKLAHRIQQAVRVIAR